MWHQTHYDVTDKTITLVLKFSTNIITSNSITACHIGLTYDDNVCFELQDCCYSISKEYFVDFSVNFIGLPNVQGPIWSWSYGSWIYNYLCNQCLSPLKLSVRTCSWWGVLNTTLSDKVCQWLAIGQWFSPCAPVSSTNKTNRHDIIEILLKVALNTINQTKYAAYNGLLFENHV